MYRCFFLLYAQRRFFWTNGKGRIHQMCVEYKTINRTHLGKRNFVRRNWAGVYGTHAVPHKAHRVFFTYATNINGNSTEDFYLNKYTNICRAQCRINLYCIYLFIFGRILIFLLFSSKTFCLEWKIIEVSFFRFFWNWNISLLSMHISTSINDWSTDFNILFISNKWKK